MNRSPNNEKRDWFQFWVHFFFGMIFGALAGVGAYSHSPYVGSSSMWPIVLFTGISAIVLGLLAGFYGDELWRQIVKFF